MAPLHRTAPIPVSVALAAMGRRGVSAEPPISARTLLVVALAMALAVVVAEVARGLGLLISLVTNLAFHQQWSLTRTAPVLGHAAWWVVLVPVAGGLVVGLMARYGSRAIRGHGIPEAMEQVLTNDSRIPARMMLLKPLSAALSIGTGGPFGAEGPIIASGGAIGSALGQLLPVSASERKTLLAAGAAAGMAATFGSPVSAVLLAVELLLFEYRARSLIPVSCACAIAATMRIGWAGTAPVFAMPSLAAAGGGAMAGSALVGLACGLGAVAVTRLVYGIEAGFARLSVPWMWWPALGGVVVGVVGWIDPRTLGMGYANLDLLLGGTAATASIALLLIGKGLSWSVALGSGTSGGTLAPLFTLGGALGALLGILLTHLAPGLGCDPRLAALVGMAALFAGASRALLASVVFAVEATHAATGALPLVLGCSLSCLVASWLARHSLMTEKIARRGVLISEGYGVDAFASMTVASHCSRSPVAVRAERSAAAACAAVVAAGARHHSYPVIDGHATVLGVVGWRALAAAGAAQPVASLLSGAPAVIAPECTLREAIVRMHELDVGRLAVVGADGLVGMLSARDVLDSQRRLAHQHQAQDAVLGLHQLGRWWPRREAETGTP